MRHRVFIAINLPENIKKKLSDYELKWPELPGRWTKKENLHITLNFLGYLKTDEELLEVIKKTREAALKNDPFFLNLKRIIYGPSGKPRMIWAEGEKSEELKKLQEDLINALKDFAMESGGERDRAYTPHITLARLRQWEFQRMEPEEKPKINEEISLNFEVSSIEVMESELKRAGPEYITLESAPLNL